MLKKYLILIPLVFASIFGYSQDSSKFDEVARLLEKADDDSKSNIEKLSFAESAKRLSEKISNDSLKNQALRYIALNHFKLENFNLFKKASQEFLIHSLEINDSSSMARANVYLGEFYGKASRSDSAYFHYYNAEKMLKAIGDDIELGKTLLKIAIIQKNEKDFIGSEVTTIEAIGLLEGSGEIRYLASLYNNLGIISNNLGKYDEAVINHKKALDFRKKLDDMKIEQVESSYNNLAVVYKNKKQYDQALKNFNLILENKKLREERPSFYAVVLDNYAHTKFLLNQTEQIPDLYYKALKVCDSVKDNYSAIAINIHLSEYYLSINQLDLAKKYGYTAKNIAFDFHNDDYLKALLHLSKIEDDSLSVKYYQEYIALNDSLVENERAVRNKFARIRFETTEIEKKNEQITKERLYLLILSIGLLLTIFLIYNVITQRAKNKELRLNQLQQEANEEIYNLMLTQQDKIDEGRAKEKTRISEELHDGILGRLFGTRLSLDSLNNNKDEDAVKNRAVYIEELKSIEQEIRKISHDLNSDFVEGSSYFDIIRTLVENQTQAYQLSYDLKNNDDINWELISNKTKINLYRIVQESLQNIYKHAKANHVKIKFDSKEDFIILEITDDGKGFDVNKAGKGIGLKNIQSRAKENGGEIKIESVIDQGTTIIINIPK